MTSNQNYCLILAGGAGTRLWPLSQESKPKQFQDIFGTGRTLLQQTYDRFLRFIQPDHIYISTTQQHLHLVEAQLPNVPRSQIIAEPVRRGTLASVALGSLIIAAKRDAQANIVCSPADQWITDEGTFQSDIAKGLAFSAKTDGIVTVGLRPTRPETEYGYIQMGEEREEGFYHVKSFTEKPERAYAEMFIETGEFLWNVGLFMFNVQVMLRQVTKHVPAYQIELPRMMAQLAATERREVPEVFSVLPNLNIDYGILEGSSKTFVQQAHFGWADLGSWESLHVDAPADSNENIVLDTDSQLYDCHGNIIRLPRGHLALISGLKDYVVAEENGILMICPRKDVAMMRRMHNEARLAESTKG